MKVFGIDPGATTGWLLYDAEGRAVLHAGEFRGDVLPSEAVECARSAEYVVIESLHEPRGNIYPAVVQSAITQGHLERQLLGLLREPTRITRAEVKRELTKATLGEPVVQTDKHAWQALVVLHGPGCDERPRVRKGVEVSPGGAIGRITAHQRAALAAVVAWLMARGLWIAEGASR